MKRFAEAGDPPVVIPVVGVAADDHVALVVPAAEGGPNCNVWNAIHATAP